MKYVIINHGVEHTQYFQGCSSGEYDYVFTGIGSSTAEALEDCLEQIACSIDGNQDLIDKIEEENKDMLENKEVLIEADEYFQEVYVYVSILFSL